MVIRLLKQEEHSSYEAFVKKHPHGSLFQSIAWQEYCEKAFDLKSIIIIGEEKGRIVNSALIFEYPLPFQKSYLYAPRGPLFSENKDENRELINEIEIICRGRRSASPTRQPIFFRFDPLIPVTTPISKYIDYPDLQTSTSHHPKTTLTLDLQLNEEELLKQMKEKGRYNIRLAEKKGVTVRHGSIQELYPLLADTGKRDGFSVHSEKVYQTMVNVFKENSLILVAEYENTIIAGGIFLFHPPTAIYYYGASSNAYRNVMAPYLIQWRAIQEAKKRGCAIYDFLGIADEGVEKHPLAGVTDFKKKFGGRVESYMGAFVIPYSKFWTNIYGLYKKIR